jgi:predicted nucleic-acid-binding protein
MRAVDTNVVVRVIVRDNLSQTASAESFVQDGAWISILALAETVWVLATSYGFSASDSANAIEMLLNHRDFVLEDPGVVTAALHLFRAKPSPGFSDCLMLSLARKAGHLPLGTFDHKLGRVDGAQKI